MLIINSSLGQFFGNFDITGMVIGGGEQEQIIRIINWSFENSSNYYYENVTINNSVELKKFINLVEWQEKNISEQKIKKATYNGEDKTEKLNRISHGNLKVNKNNLLYLEFYENLIDEDIILLYILGPEEANITIELCAGNGSGSCEVVNGKIHFNGTEELQPYNITIENLENQSSLFIINISTDESPKFIKIDYVKAIKTETIKHEIIEESYAEYGFIETTFVEDDIEKWLYFEKQSLVDINNSNQKIDYYYNNDIDINGSSNEWDLMNLTNNNSFNLSNVSGNKIKFKIELFSDNSSTPVLEFMSLEYKIKSKNESESNETEEFGSGNGASGGGGGSGGGGSFTSIIEKTEIKEEQGKQQETEEERIIRIIKKPIEETPPSSSRKNLDLIIDSTIIFLFLAVTIYFVDKKERKRKN